MKQHKYEVTFECVTVDKGYMPHTLTAWSDDGPGRAVFIAYRNATALGLKVHDFKSVEDMGPR